MQGRRRGSQGRQGQGYGSGKGLGQMNTKPQGNKVYGKRLWGNDVPMFKGTTGNRNDAKAYKEAYARLDEHAKEFTKLEKKWSKYTKERKKTVGEHYAKNLTQTISQQYIDSPGGQGVNQTIKEWMGMWKTNVTQLCQYEKQSFDLYLQSMIDNLKAYPKVIKEMKKQIQVNEKLFFAFMSLEDKNYSSQADESKRGKYTAAKTAFIQNTVALKTKYKEYVVQRVTNLKFQAILDIHAEMSFHAEAIQSLSTLLKGLKGTKKSHLVAQEILNGCLQGGVVKTSLEGPNPELDLSMSFSVVNDPNARPQQQQRQHLSPPNGRDNLHDMRMEPSENESDRGRPGNQRRGQRGRGNNQRFDQEEPLDNVNAPQRSKKKQRKKNARKPDSNFQNMGHSDSGDDRDFRGQQKGNEGPGGRRVGFEEDRDDERD